ncbi:CorA family divalent cation transporter [Jannaschia sp. 2305UL9-9]|uniref:CorA family divalent cation transporter n=1 Tax=Jannaschia sp. 2305UL9-9 TaxID=3121638 RepID=UPI00352766D4
MTDISSRSPAGFGLTGALRGQVLTGEALGQALEGADLAWVHLSLADGGWQAADDWLDAHVPGLDPTTRRALTEELTRPRAIVSGPGLMIVLRGVNLAEGEDPDDMVSVRVYLDDRRIVTLARRHLRSVADLADKVSAGKGPESPGAFLYDLSEALIGRIESVLEDAETDTDALEVRVDEHALDRVEATHARSEATRLRRMVLGLRRHIGPQRDALSGAATLVPDLIGKVDRRRLLEIRERHQHAVEELDELAGRLTLVRDEIRAEQDERTNRNLYFLSVLSALFLPLGFLTGLLGVNVGGIPGADHPHGFAIFCSVLFAVFVGQIAILLRMRRL